ncbi:MAG TPA: CDP-alcohol phosphatidyltransferase family protein [Cellulomonas sp.]
MVSRLRAAWTTLMNPIAGALLKAGVSPDAVTIGGTVVSVGLALWLFPTGHLFLAAILLGVFTVLDTVDGVMARRSGRSGPWGAFLDSTLDRFADGAIFAGLVLWYTGRGADRLTAIFALACLVLGAIVPYARARAEGLGMTANVGVAERGDRILVSLVAAGLVGLGVPHVLLTVALALLAVGSLVTVVQRMLVVRRQVREAAS